MISKLITSLLLLMSIYGNAQPKKIIIDASNNKPIEFANVLATKLKKGVISNLTGEIIWNIFEVEKDDTILVSHVSYEPLYISFKFFQLIDTIILKPKFASLLEVIVKQDIDIALYKNENTLGYAQNKYEGGIYMRPGQQLGVRIENPTNVKGVIKEVKLSFDKLLPNSSFRIRIKKNDNDSNFKVDLIPNGIVVKPTKLKTILNLTDYKVLLPSNGVFVDVDYLGDGNVYKNWMDAPYIIYKKTHKYDEYNTYSNYMDAYKWNKWNTIIRNEKNPFNAQIQIKVLSK